MRTYELSAFAGVVALSIASCSGESGPRGEAAYVTSAEEAPGANCAYGGQRIEARVGAATPTVAYVCNGAAGADGAAGESASVSVEDEAPGANCANGGKRITTSVGSGAVTTSYVCNGLNGTGAVVVVAEPPGANCAVGGVKVTGSNGAPQYVCNGQNGMYGSDGKGVTVTAEGPGSNCAYGGVKVQVDAGAPEYVCNGPSGRLLTVDAGANQTVDETTATVTLSGTAAAGAAALWQQLAGPPVVLSGATSLTASFAPPNVARDELLLFRLSATSGTVTELDEVTVQVSFVNAAPMVTVPASFTVAAGTEVVLSGLGSDPDGQIVTYTWTQTGGAAVVLHGTTQPSVEFVAPSKPIASELGFQLEVSDGLASTTGTVTVSVNALNVGPIVDFVPNLSASTGCSFSYQVVASDANASDTLTYALTPETTMLPPWAYLNPVTGQITGTPKVGAGRTSGLRVRVTDSAGVFTDSNSFSIESLPGVAARLSFGMNPPHRIMPGEQWPVFTVRIEDEYGNLVTTDNSTWVYVTNVRGAFLSGTLAQRAEEGVATFDDLTSTIGDVVFDIKAAGLSDKRTRYTRVSVKWPSFVPLPKVDYATGMEPASVATGDFNGDGRIDLAIACFSSITVFIADPASPGVFLAGTDYETGCGASSVTASDLDGDGWLDLATANGCSDAVSVLLADPASPGIFLSKVDYDAGGAPQSVAAADLNGDGWVDLAVTNYLSSRVSVLLADPMSPGTFPAKADYAVGSRPTSVTTGDFNGDGRPDLVVASEGSDTVSVLLADPLLPGAFLAKVDYSTGSWPTSVTTGDFDGDGRLDLAVANWNSDRVSVLLADPSVPGTFLAKSDYDAGRGANAVTAADLNGDGRLDLVVANGSTVVSVLLADPMAPGAFQAKSEYGAGSTPASVAAADLNGDGKLDLAAANYDSSTASILLQAPAVSGAYDSWTGYSAGSVPLAVAIGDFNGDGRLDIASANVDSDDVSILLQDPSRPGVFGAAISFAVGQWPWAKAPWAIAAGDLDGDGRLDLATANRGSDSVSVLLQDPAAAGTFQAAVTYAADGSPRSIMIGDLDRDGRPDLVTADYYTGTVSARLQDPSVPGTFQGAVQYAVGAHPKSVATGDLDRDGHLDLVATSDAGMSVLLQEPATRGTFKQAVSYAAGPAPYAVALGDLDGDGRLDIVVTDETSLQSEVRVLFQSPAVPGTFGVATVRASGAGRWIAIEDLNADGRLDLATDGVFVNLQDPAKPGTFGPAAYIEASSVTSGGAVGDLNGDGQPDLVSTYVDQVTVLLGR